MQYLNESAIKTSKIARSGIYISENRIIYFGPIEQLDVHQYGATVLQIGIYSPFYIRFQNRWVATRCAMIPAGFKHEIKYPKGIFGKLFIEQQSQDYHCLMQRFPVSVERISLFYDAEAIRCFQEIYEYGVELSEINQAIDRLIHFSETGCSGFDQRIDHVIQLLDSEPDRIFSLDHLAQSCDLSASRLQHLFKSELGIPYTQFRLWQRIRAAEIFLNQTDSLTMAAVETGFSDLSHFSRKYKQTFGIKPSLVFKHLKDFEVQR